MDSSENIAQETVKNIEIPNDEKDIQTKKAEEIQQTFTALTKDQCQIYAEQNAKKEVIAAKNEEEKRKIDIFLGQVIPECETSRDTKNITELNIVLLGRTGEGKSATGNLILGKDMFETSNRQISCTRTTEIHENKINGITVRVADTPGSFDESMDKKAITAELMKVGLYFNGGIHAFIFVYNLGNPCFTEEKKKAFHQIKEQFGPQMLAHCFILFTHAKSILDDDNTKTMKLEKYLDYLMCHNGIEDNDEDIDNIFWSVGCQVVAVENKTVSKYEKESQQKRLVEFIQFTVANADKITYTVDIIKKVQADLGERMKSMEKELAKLSPETKAKLMQTVLKYIMDRNYAELKKMRDKTKIQSGVQEIIGGNPTLGSHGNLVKEALKSHAEVLVIDRSLESLAILLLKAAGFAFLFATPAIRMAMFSSIYKRVVAMFKQF